jgi:hypothetical protein
MRIIPVSLEIANEFVGRLHRHHSPVQGHRFSIGAVHDGTLRGVAIIGRPVAPRGYNHRIVVEVTRCCTDGSRNACSLLYGAAARSAQAQGYYGILTYTLATEDGASLRAAGWWDAPAEEYTSSFPAFGSSSRERFQEYLGAKTRWIRLLNDWPDFIPSLDPQGSLL